MIRAWKSLFLLTLEQVDLGLPAKGPKVKEGRVWHQPLTSKIKQIDRSRAGRLWSVHLHFNFYKSRKVGWTAFFDIHASFFLKRAYLVVFCSKSAKKGCPLAISSSSITPKIWITSVASMLFSWCCKSTCMLRK